MATIKSAAKMAKTPKFNQSRLLGSLLVSLIGAATLNLFANTEAGALGLIRPHVTKCFAGSPKTSHAVNYGNLPHRPAYAARYANRPAKNKKGTKLAGKRGEKQVAEKPLQPQAYISMLSSESLAPGVVHKFYRGGLNINLVDVDMEHAPVKVQPSLAGEAFNHLKDVADHARDNKAIAAINANYFKRDGTPLGTLIIDGEWVAGPIYDRVSMGIDRDGKIKIDRVSLNGLISSSNEKVDNVWVNSINQPRRTGAHLIAYTRRWGSFVKTPYEGCLVAVNAQGDVQDTGTDLMGIPWGGFVLSDTKSGAISSLKRGDKVQLSWHTRPNDWQDVVEAVSGGPMLIKDGNLYVDCKDEKFRGGWTGCGIKARTAVGVTANNHLLMLTVEGAHTLWDVAKFLHNLGAVDAMNLDGGGSTTMVVNGSTVTRNKNASQRRVASSIIVVDLRKNNALTSRAKPPSQPGEAMSDLSESLNNISGPSKEITAALPLKVNSKESTSTPSEDALQVPMVP
jgi:exopolysaccharide biosynthesis protein